MQRCIQMQHSCSDTRLHLQESFIAIAPLRERFAIFGQPLKLLKWGPLVISGAKEKRDNHRFAGLIPFDRSCHFNAVTVLRSQKVWADQQEDQVGSIQMLMTF